MAYIPIYNNSGYQLGSLVVQIVVTSYQEDLVKYFKFWIVGLIAFLMIGGALAVSYAHAMPAQPTCAAFGAGLFGPGLQEAQAFCQNYPGVPVTSWNVTNGGDLPGIEKTSTDAASFSRVIVGALQSTGPDVDWTGIAQTRVNFNSEFHIEAHHTSTATWYGVYDGNNALRFSEVL